MLIKQLTVTQRRDQLLAELVALWESSGRLCRLESGLRIPRKDREWELIRALRPLCAAAKAERESKPKKASKK